MIDEFVERSEPSLTDVENAVDKTNAKMFIFAYWDNWWRGVGRKPRGKGMERRDSRVKKVLC